MDESHENLIKSVRHYQDGLERHTDNRNDERLIHYLERLHKLPIKVIHLERTGVGRTVNGLRKLGGEVGDFAKSLVSKWKDMVVGEQQAEEDEDEEEEEDGYQTGEDASNDSDDNGVHVEDQVNHESNTSSHRQSDGHRTSEANKNKRSKDLTVKPEDSKQKDHKDNGHTSSNNKHKSLKRKIEDFSNEKDNSRKKSKKDDALHEEERPSKHHRQTVRSDSEEEMKHKDKKHKSHDDRKGKSKKSKDPDSDGEDQHKSGSSKEKRKENSSDKHKSSKKHVEKKHDHNKKSKKKEHKESSKSKEKEVCKTSDDKKHKSSSTSLSHCGINSESGPSFAEALGMCEPSSSKNFTKKKSSSGDKKEKHSSVSENVVPKLLKEPNLDPIDINLSSLLPTLTPNYRPLGNLIASDPQPKRSLSEYEALSNIITSKNQRTKVYSGNKMGYGKVPSLFDLCIRTLQDNIDALEYTGGVPYSILKPIMEKCTPVQLHTLEHHNPYLIEETDELWQLHCQKEFRNKEREEFETWRDMYLRCLDERDAKLRALTANIKQAQDKSVPVRTTKLAYVDAVAKPPRNIARKQAKNGIVFDRKPSMTPAARLSSLAMSGEAGKVAVPNPGARAVERGSSHPVKPKKAPLMLKSISSFKNRFKR